MSSSRTEQQIFDDLSLLCTSPGYSHAIAYFCYRDHAVAYSKTLKGEDYAKLFSSERLIRTEISTIIGLMARAPRDLSLPAPEIVQGYIDRTEHLLKELHEALNKPILDGLEKAFAESQGKREFNPFASAEALREPIFYSAESAYSFQYRDLSAQKYARDEAWLKREKGFTPRQAQQLVKALCSFLNEKLFHTLKSLKGLPPEQWSFLSGFQFTAADLVDRLDMSKQTIDAIIDAFTYAEDGNKTFTALNEFNSTNAFPVLKADGDIRILFLYVSLTEALYDTPFYWMGSDKNYSPTAMSNRGAFTEEFTAARLERVFGKEQVLLNVDVWESGTKKKKLGEIDALVLYGDRAIVVQAKSKKLTLAARKGNDLQLQADFKAAVRNACDQAILCCKLLIEGKAFLADSLGNEVAPNFRTKKAYPICVVSDHYPALSFQAQQFMSVEATGQIERPLVCDVFFVDVVTEFLETPLTFLSYIELRAKAANNLSLSHEIVALAYHLRQNLWLGEYDFMALADDISADVDVAMAARRDGVDGNRNLSGVLSRLKNTAVGKIVSSIERCQDPGAIATGLELLKLSGKSTDDLSRMVRRIIAEASRDGDLHDCTVAIGQDGSGITVHCSALPDLVAGPTLRRHCERRKYIAKASRWFGLVLRPSDGAVRFGLTLEYPWKRDVAMDVAVADMPKLQSATNVEALLLGNVPQKAGRNDPCPCGSGLKYKKCHLSRGGF